MQWEQARHGLEFRDLGWQGAPEGGSLETEAALVLLAATCKGEGQKEGWTPASVGPERGLHQRGQVEAASGSRG